MKFDFKSALIGALIASNLWLLTAFSQVQNLGLTQAQRDVLNTLSVVYIPDCNDGPGYKTLRATGVNLQVVNGIGNTDSTNGVGNLIVGYNEDIGGCNRSGSHNAIIGRYNSYSSFGGLTAGESNQILNSFAVAFGLQNNAIGQYSTILGGVSNTTNNVYSTICGGTNNFINGGYSVIVGGTLNNVNSTGGVVGGGYSNLVDTAADYGVVSGGQSRSVLGNFNWRAGSLLENN